MKDRRREVFLDHRSEEQQDGRTLPYPEEKRKVGTSTPWRTRTHLSGLVCSFKIGVGGDCRGKLESPHVPLSYRVGGLLPGSLLRRTRDCNPSDPRTPFLQTPKTYPRREQSIFTHIELLLVLFQKVSRPRENGLRFSSWLWWKEYYAYCYLMKIELHNINFHD